MSNFQIQIVEIRFCYIGLFRFSMGYDLNSIYINLVYKQAENPRIMELSLGASESCL